MSMAAQQASIVRDDAYVRILLFRGHALLCHDGTGEIVRLGPAEDIGKYTLDFSESGVGAVVHPDKAPRLIRDLLALRLCRGPRAGHAAPQLFIGGPHGYSRWFADVSKYYKAHCFKRQNESSCFVFVGEVYEFEVAKGPHFFWWAAPRFRAAIFPQVQHHNWAGRSAAKRSVMSARSTRSLEAPGHTSQPRLMQPSRARRRSPTATRPPPPSPRRTCTATGSRRGIA